jgi:uncharacterized membrane protein
VKVTKSVNAAPIFQILLLTLDCLPLNQFVRFSMRPVDRSIIFSVWCCGQLGSHPTKTLLALGTMAKRGAQPVAGMIGRTGKAIARFIL